MIDVKELRKLKQDLLISRQAYVNLEQQFIEYMDSAADDYIARTQSLLDDNAKLTEVLKAVRMSLVESHHSPECIFGRVMKAVEACADIQIEGDASNGN